MEAFINVHPCSLAIKIGARTYLDRNTQSRMARLRHVRVSGNDGTRWQRHGLRGKGGMHAGRPLFSGRQQCAAAQHNTTQHNIFKKKNPHKLQAQASTLLSQRNGPLVSTHLILNNRNEYMNRRGRTVYGIINLKIDTISKTEYKHKIDYKINRNLQGADDATLHIIPHELTSFY
jgi:hypothetical protein